MVGSSQALWSEWEKGTRRPGVAMRAVIESITDVIKAAEWVPDDEPANDADPAKKAG